MGDELVRQDRHCVFHLSCWNHLCTITAPSLHHHSAITAPSLHHHCTITVPSLFHRQQEEEEAKATTAQRLQEKALQYYHGRDVQQDKSKAAELFAQAVEQGHAAAQLYSTCTPCKFNQLNKQFNSTKKPDADLNNPAWIEPSLIGWKTSYQMMEAPSLHHHCTITEPSLHHHCTITAPSLRHHCTITAICDVVCAG